MTLALFASVLTTLAIITAAWRRGARAARLWEERLARGMPLPPKMLPAPDACVFALPLPAPAGEDPKPSTVVTDDEWAEVLKGIGEPPRKLALLEGGAGGRAGRQVRRAAERAARKAAWREMRARGVVGVDFS